MTCLLSFAGPEMERNSTLSKELWILGDSSSPGPDLTNSGLGADKRGEAFRDKCILHVGGTRIPGGRGTDCSPLPGVQPRVGTSADV